MLINKELFDMVFDNILPAICVSPSKATGKARMMANLKHVGEDLNFLGAHVFEDEKYQGMLITQFDFQGVETEEFRYERVFVPVRYYQNSEESI